VLVREESLAGVMAEVYGRLTRKPGVILGQAPGRVSDDEVTLFDGTGLGLQDLAMAQLVLSKASQAGDVAVFEI